MHLTIMNSGNRGSTTLHVASKLTLGPDLQLAMEEKSVEDHSSSFYGPT